MSNPLDFTGKIVLVTGSSRGIGAEMIKAFGARAAECVVNYIADAQGENKTDAVNVAKELNEPLLIECDVTQPEQVEAMMKQIQDRHGGLDVLVNNSGIIGDRTIKKMSLDNFESVVRVNLIGTFLVTQKAAVILRNGGRIINMSSVSGEMGLFGQANYSSSKAGIIALTKVSAREFARQNITVNAIAPGFIDVGMSKGMPDEVVYHRARLERERRLLHGMRHGSVDRFNSSTSASAQSNFCTSNQTKAESIAANVDKT